MSDESSTANPHIPYKPLETTSASPSPVSIHTDEPKALGEEEANVNAGDASKATTKPI